MFGSKCLQVAVLAVAGFGLGLAPASDAAAGSCKSDRSYSDRSYNRSHNVSYHSRSYSHRDYSHRDRSYSRVNATYRNDNVRFSVSIGSGSHDRGYDRGYHQPRYRSSSCDRTVVVHHPPQPVGYWKRVYHSPVYETRYDSCGRPYRVCVRAGYYERIWVSSDYRY